MKSNDRSTNCASIIFLLQIINNKYKKHFCIIMVSTSFKSSQGEWEDFLNKSFAQRMHSVKSASNARLSQIDKRYNLSSTKLNLAPSSIPNGSQNLKILPEKYSVKKKLHVLVDLYLKVKMFHKDLSIQQKLNWGGNEISLIREFILLRLDFMLSDIQSDLKAKREKESEKPIENSPITFKESNK